MAKPRVQCEFSWIHDDTVHSGVMAMDAEEFVRLRKAVEAWTTRHLALLAATGVKDFAFIEVPSGGASTPPVELLDSLRSEDLSLYGDDPECANGEARAAWVVLERRARALPPATPDDRVHAGLRFVWNGAQLFEDGICVSASHAEAAVAWLRDLGDQLASGNEGVGEVEAFIDSRLPRLSRPASVVRRLDGLLRKHLPREALPGSDPAIAVLAAASRHAKRLSAPLPSRRPRLRA